MSITFVYRDENNKVQISNCDDNDQENNSEVIKSKQNEENEPMKEENYSDKAKEEQDDIDKTNNEVKLNCVLSLTELLFCIVLP